MGDDQAQEFGIGQVRFTAAAQRFPRIESREDLVIKDNIKCCQEGVELFVHTIVLTPSALNVGTRRELLYMGEFDRRRNELLSKATMLPKPASHHNQSQSTTNVGGGLGVKTYRERAAHPPASTNNSARESPR